MDTSFTKIILFKSQAHWPHNSEVKVVKWNSTATYALLEFTNGERLWVYKDEFGYQKKTEQ